MCHTSLVSRSVITLCLIKSSMKGFCLEKVEDKEATEESVEGAPEDRPQNQVQQNASVHQHLGLISQKRSKESQIKCVLEFIFLQWFESFENEEDKPWDRRGDPQNDLRRGIPESERCLQLPWDDHFLFWPAPQSSTLSDCFQSSSSRSPSPWELLQPLAFSFPLLLSFDLRQMALSPVWWWDYIEFL